MLTHYLTRRRLGAYLDGALSEATARATAAHLGTCAVCRREADELGRLRGLLQRSLSVAEPDWTGFWSGVVRGIDAAKTPSRESARRIPGWIPGWTQYRPQWTVGGALAAALLVSVGFWQLGPDNPAQDPGVIVRSASTGDPRATVMVYGTPERDVAVVWVLGLDEK